jgi:hypothetical protein
MIAAQAPGSGGGVVEEMLSARREDRLRVGKVPVDRQPLDTGAVGDWLVRKEAARKYKHEVRQNGHWPGGSLSLADAGHRRDVSAPPVGRSLAR